MIPDVLKRNMALRTCLMAGVALALFGCNVEKLANRMEAGESHFPSGRQEARGGVSYSASGSARDWSRTISTCRSSVAASVRFGASGGDLPLTITQDGGGPSSVQLQSPDGVLTFNRQACSVLKSDPIPDSAATAVPGSTGNIVFECSNDGKTVRGRVLFNQCGS